MPYIPLMTELPKTGDVELQINPNNMLHFRSHRRN